MSTINNTNNSNNTFNTTHNNLNNTTSGWSFSSMPNLSDWVPDFKNWEAPRIPTSEELSAGFEKTAITLILHVVPIALSTLAIAKTANLVYKDLCQKTIQHGEKSAHGLTSGQKLVTVVFGAIVTTLAATFIYERAEAFKAFHFTATPV